MSVYLSLYGSLITASCMYSFKEYNHQMRHAHTHTHIYACMRAWEDICGVMDMAT